MIPLRFQLERRTLNLMANDNPISWYTARKRYLKKNGAMCECCGYKKKIEVHHIIPRHVRPDLTTDLGNLIAMCDDCHFHIGHHNSYRRYNPYVVTDSAFVYRSVIKNKIYKQKNKI